MARRSGKTPGTDTWYQSPPFARNFNILDDPTIYLYVRSAQNDNNNNHGNNNANYTVTLISSNASSSTVLGSVAIKWINLTTNNVYLIPANIHLTTRNVTIPAGNQLTIRIDNWDSDTLGVYQSTQYPARVNMNTQSYIDVENVSFTDSSYNPITSATPPSTIKVIANITDPFGYFDIVNATVYATDSSGNIVISPVAMTLNSTDSRLWKKLEANIPLSSSLDTGVYNFVVNATETNGVTDAMSAQLPIIYPVNVSVSKSFAPTGNPDEYAVTINLTNRDTAHSVYGVQAYDYTTDYYWDSNINVAWTYVTVNNGILNGRINVFGPFNLAPGDDQVHYICRPGIPGL